MKRRHIIAMAIGALISAIFLAASVDWLSPGMRGLGQMLGFPGIIAVIMIWGVHGGQTSEILAAAVMWAVNAAAYGLVALAALSIFKISN